MKRMPFLRSGAMMLALLLTAAAPVLSSAAEEDAVPEGEPVAIEDVDAGPDADSGDAGDSAGAEEFVLPDDSEEFDTFTCGDYVYSKVHDADDESIEAACIEGYNGTDAEVVIPETLDGLDVVLIGDYAFISTFPMTKVTIPNSVVGLGTFCFANCTNLTAFEVADDHPCFETRDGILYTDNSTVLLRYPIGKAEADITVPEGITAIGDVAFANCRTLSSLKLPESLESIGVSAVSDCDSLREIVIPENVTALSNYAFNNCSMLSKVTLPSGLKTIGDAVFTATALEEITLPDSLTSIGQQAFADTPMKEVTIPASVQEIGYSAFGWYADSSSSEMLMNASFVIRGEKGSAAEKYAKDAENGNAFQFADINTETETAETAADSTAPVSQPDDEQPEDEDSHIGRIIGISACGTMLTCILAMAACSGKKKSADEPQEKEETSEHDASAEK